MLRRPPRSTLTDPLFPNTTLCRSKDGTRLLYAVQDGGTDWRVVRVKDVATGEDLPDEVRWVKFSALDWAKDGSGFYYSRFPAPERSEEHTSELQSLMRISYAVFCLKKTKHNHRPQCKKRQPQ